MTVVVGVKVFEGFVIAADSATTLKLPDGSHQVYENANKIFHLHRDFPIAAATWGLGGLGSATIGTLAKDLRRRFMGRDHLRADWELSPFSYTVEGVADRLVEMMYDELFKPLVESGQLAADTLGFLVAGYSAGKQEAEVWTVQIDDPTVRPTPILEAGPLDFGWSAYAIKEAAYRLFHGFDPAILDQLKAVTAPTEHGAVEAVISMGARTPVHPAMPYADAIKLARFIADVTIGYVQFLLGPNVVGGPVEIAGLSRHEGFKWVQRKHYYPGELNPKEPNHDV